MHFKLHFKDYSSIFLWFRFTPSYLCFQGLRHVTESLTIYKNMRYSSKFKRLSAMFRFQNVCGTSPGFVSSQFLHCNYSWILIALRVAANQTFPGILSWGAWISIPVYSCQIVVFLDFFHVIDYNSQNTMETNMNRIKKSCIYVGYGRSYV